MNKPGAAFDRIVSAVAVCRPTKQEQQWLLPVDKEGMKCDVEHSSARLTGDDRGRGLLMNRRGKRRSRRSPGFGAELVLAGALLIGLICATTAKGAFLGLSGAETTGAISQGPSEKIASPPPPPPAPILYDQFDSFSTSAVITQDFEDARNVLDSEAADDFVVPAGQQWNISEVDIYGIYLGGEPPTSVHVRFYRNAAGDLPGVMLAERLDQTYKVSFGEILITVAPPVDLGPGTYWVGVQARLDNAPGNRYAAWVMRTVLSNAGAAWKNPGNGWHTGCTMFQRRPTCIPEFQDPDQVYRLRGTTGPPPPPPPPAPPAAPPPPPPPHVRPCMVPRVIGLRLARARARIRRASCSVGRIRRVRSRRVARVIRQSPRAGSRRPRGAPVNLVVGQR